jgi:DNA processing protein
MSKTLWLTISKVPGVGAKTLANLYKNFPGLTYEELRLNPTMITKTIRSQKSSSYINNLAYMDELMKQSEEDIETYQKEGFSLIFIGDSIYPRYLKEIKDAPLFLYCRGNLDALLLKKKIAVIGTRKATPKGLNVAAKIANTFAKMDYAIVSGLADGIDTAGHIGALQANGVTIAVLPSGVDDASIFPAKNKNLAKQIIENNGLILSEFPPGSKAFKASFIQRDRLQSGLSLGVCPVQTDITGGTQHTIKFAEEQQRLIFCPVPQEEGDIPAYRGVHHLLKTGRAHALKDKNSYQELDQLMEKLTVNVSKCTDGDINLFNF